MKHDKNKDDAEALGAAAGGGSGRPADHGAERPADRGAGDHGAAESAGPDGERWDRRYDAEDYVYGTAPNDFLAEQVDQLPRGPILSMCEGEGRNAVFLAERGHEVTAVDASGVGLAKARRLAEMRNVSLKTVVADLSTLELGRESYAGAVSVFCHLPTEDRSALYPRVLEALRPGGVLILEAYTPRQLAYGTGGPPTEERLVTLAHLREVLGGMEFLVARELEREVYEGRLHSGPAHVVQVVGRKSL
jgi:SAM-dependent methyltransferase